MTSLIRRSGTDLAPRRPFADLEDLFTRFFQDFPLATVDAEGGAWVPAVDLHETADAYILDAELPGLTKDNIEIDVMDDTVTLKGVRKFEEEKKEKNYHRIERRYGSFQRSFRLAGGIEAEKVEASFKDGVLHLKLPKPVGAKPKRIQVKA